MSARTLAEFCYILASAAVTYAVVAIAAWAYPWGSDTIWKVGLAAMAFVVVFATKPFLDSWRADRAAAAPRKDDRAA